MSLWAATDSAAGTPVLCRKMGDTDRRELQAERFAAHLLMPEYLMRDAVVGRELSRWDSIRALAQDCGVSKKAMTRRLEELRLIQLGPDGQLWAYGALEGVRRMF